ncbi:probable inactive serine/threonine-protein kinase scy1 [Tanacetum coccineum]
MLITAIAKWLICPARYVEGDAEIMLKNMIVLKYSTPKFARRLQSAGIELGFSLENFSHHLALHRSDRYWKRLKIWVYEEQVDGSPVSIFSLTGSNAGDGRLAAGRNGVKRLRTVRHPNILSFLHSTEAEINDGSSTKVTIYIVTEPVMPLAEKIKELGLQGTKRDEYYAWGLQRIAKAVSFLNNDCKLVHGNVCLESVVVTQTLDWKLHGFDVLSEFDGNNEASAGPMLQYDWLVGSQYKPVELAKSDWASIRKSPPWAIDSWGLGCLIYEIFSGLKLSKTEELRNTASLPKSLLPDYQRLLNSTPSRRLNSSKLLENCEYFQNKLVDTIHFMEILNLKDSVEKDTFFRKLPTLAEQLPREIVLKKLLPLLASALEFGSAAAPALTPLLKIGAWLSPEEFNIKVLPTLVKLFASNDRAIRVGLLQHIDQFGESLSAQVVDEQVYPHIATGFSDTSAFLRELTLKSMLVLAPKLSQRTLSGSLLKYLSKLQTKNKASNNYLLFDVLGVWSSPYGLVDFIEVSMFRFCIVLQ